VDSAKVNRRVLEGLIQCGAFDFTGIERSRLFASLDEVLRLCGTGQDPNQLNIFSCLKGDDPAAPALLQIPDLEEWDEKEKLKREKESLGFYITGHPLDRYEAEVAQFSSCTVQDLSNLTDRTTVKVAGVIENLKIKKTKRGEKMAVLSFEDRTGSVEVIVFPDAFSAYSALLKSEEPLLITGTAEVDDNAAKIISQEIKSLERVRETAIKGIEVNLPQEIISKGILEDIKDIIFKYPGESAILFRVGTAGGEQFLVIAHHRYKVSPCREMIKELETRIGQKVACNYGEKNSNHSHAEHS
jgi:DNA polymerase-3 subunit alpha